MVAGGPPRMGEDDPTCQCFNGVFLEVWDALLTVSCSGGCWGFIGHSSMQSQVLGALDSLLLVLNHSFFICMYDMNMQHIIYQTLI